MIDGVVVVLVDSGCRVVVVVDDDDGAKASVVVGSNRMLLEQLQSSTRLKLQDFIIITKLDQCRVVLPKAELQRFSQITCRERTKI